MISSFALEFWQYLALTMFCLGVWSTGKRQAWLMTGMMLGYFILGLARCSNASVCGREACDGSAKPYYLNDQCVCLEPPR